MLEIFSMSPITRTILVYVGWFFLPNWATGVTVAFYNRFVSYFSLNYTPPAKGTSEAASQWRHCYAFVMFSYLAITSVYSCMAMSPNFYEILGVGPEADDQVLKLAFRTFARKNHPDRVGPQGAPHFIAVRDAYEALNHPVKRFAYDRFGPEAMTWTDCATSREYLRHGIIASSGFYIGTVGFLLVWSALGAANTGAYWRNLLLCTLFFLEFFLIVNSPSGDALGNYSFFPLSTLFRKRVPYQHTLFLHQLYMSVSIAISRVIPVLLPATRESVHTSDVAMSAVKPIVDKLAFLATMADREVSRMLSAEIRSMHGASALPSSLNATSSSHDSFATSESPFVPSNNTIAALTSEMENLIIDKQLQSHPILRGYWDAAIARQRHEHDERLSNSRLPSPPKSLSPVEPPKEFSFDREPSQFVTEKLRSIPYTRELPSPRPSPPRQVITEQSNSGYIRGRSLSY